MPAVACVQLCQRQSTARVPSAKDCDGTARAGPRRPSAAIRVAGMVPRADEAPSADDAGRDDAEEDVEEDVVQNAGASGSASSVADSAGEAAGGQGPLHRNTLDSSPAQAATARQLSATGLCLVCVCTGPSGAHTANDMPLSVTVNSAGATSTLAATSQHQPAAGGTPAQGTPGRRRLTEVRRQDTHLTSSTCPPATLSLQT